MSTAAAAGMQAALLIREKQRRKKRIRRGRLELPSHVATREIAPFPQYPTGFQCSQGRTAWQERERGRRCSLSEEARQHRIKQTEAHHRWMKRNRIHDTTYNTGSDSEEEDFLSYIHQSAAANALLYVGLGTTAIGSVIFFVGTGEKGFRTFELRLIGPTLIVCGLLCCLIRVLLCAIPCACCRKRRKTKLKPNDCSHRCSRYPLAAKYCDNPTADFVQVDKGSLLQKNKKKVSIVPPNHSLPSTSTTEFKDLPQISAQQDDTILKLPIPEIQLPVISAEEGIISREDSIIELQPLDLAYDIQSVSSYDSDSIIIETEVTTTKLSKTREPVNIHGNNNTETSLSVVIERNSESSDGNSDKPENIKEKSEKQTHSGIVLSPLQLDNN